LSPEKSAPPRLSVVVLPFANLGGDPAQEHFVDGVTESLSDNPAHHAAIGSVLEGMRKAGIPE
jgi:TolB-like protein